MTHGVAVVTLGVLPTPALALQVQTAHGLGIMVTGSHIPADRNGLKFYLPTGEITKADERAISEGYAQHATPPDAPGTLRDAAQPARNAYIARYVNAFGPTALSGLRIGVYEHSSAARDLLGTVLSKLGASVYPLGRTEEFTPVDTEAVDTESRRQFQSWCKEHQLDALVSTDGDGDRPMLTDASGKVVPGDLLGVLTARALGAKILAVPISSNSMIGTLPDFDAVRLTRIGSPYVIEAMQSAQGGLVAGFEPNGGFLLGGTARGPAGEIAPLMTRDALLPIIAPLWATRGAGIRAAIAALPPRFTASDRLQNAPQDAMRALMERLQTEAGRSAFLAPQRCAALDETDGTRMTLPNGDIVHLRPSGNAPELRVYTEADSAEAATALLTTYLNRAKTALNAPESAPC